MRTNRTWVAVTCALALVLAACGGDDAVDEPADAAATEEEAEEAEQEEAEEATEDEDAGDAPAVGDAGTIRVGFIPGPYADMFREGILPLLEADGFAVEIEEISDFTIPNQALMDGDLDANIFQNDAFMNLFNDNADGDLVSLLKIPSAGLGIYQGRGSATSPDDIEDGAVLALTSEASNLARSLAFLESLGLLTVAEVDEGELPTERDLADNPRDLSFELVDAPQVPRALPDVDYGVALGNHIYAADGVSLEDAIALETVPPESQITITVREGNADTDWARALVAAFESDTFRDFVNADPNFGNFTTPDWWG